MNPDTLPSTIGCQISNFYQLFGRYHEYQPYFDSGSRRTPCFSQCVLRCMCVAQYPTFTEGHAIVMAVQPNLLSSSGLNVRIGASSAYYQQNKKQNTLPLWLKLI